MFLWPLIRLLKTVSFSAFDRLAEILKASWSLAVYIPAVAYCKDKDNNFLIYDVADYPVVSDPVSPESGMIAFEGFSEVTGVFTSFQAVIKPANDALLDGAVQFLDLPLGNVADFNRPGQDLLSTA